MEKRFIDIIDQRTQEKEQEELEFKRSIIASYLASEFLLKYETDPRNYTLKKAAWNLEYLQNLIKEYKIILHPAYVHIDDHVFHSLPQKETDVILVRYSITNSYDNAEQFFLIPIDKRLWPDYLLNKDKAVVRFV